ncbi:unnamed protein product [Cuscuta epithymum]|uniref:Uncharacterized protein n=1 Tax=Cuscuta epithymum TaxID=186058 RepID=A0AAV0C7X8_9ASTE|nr:unnamed protein product [Cuscuta epithymum]
MGRGKGKAKKQSPHEDLGSGREEKIHPIRKRGRPVKPVKDDVKEGSDEIERIKVIEDLEDNTKGGTVLSRGVQNNQVGCENGKKTKPAPQATDNNSDLVVDEEKASIDLKKVVGFRQNASRRKNKPRRAAEVGVECR